jgi:hypothetical protein
MASLIGTDIHLGEHGNVFTDGTVTSFVGHDRNSHAPTYFMRNRFTLAAVNAGTGVMLSALARAKIRMVECKMIAIGGAAGAVTTVDLLGTQGGSSVKLAAFGQAGLVENTVLAAGDSGAAVLPAGASFEPCDINTGLTVSVTGDPVTTASHFDVLLTYNLER